MFKSDKPVCAAAPTLPYSSMEPLLALKDLLVRKSPLPVPDGSGVIVTDSRRVTPCDCFLAYKGVSGDAHQFIPLALKNGAGLLVVLCFPPRWLGHAPADMIARFRALGVLDRPLRLTIVRRFVNRYSPARPGGDASPQ